MWEEEKDLLWLACFFDGLLLMEGGKVLNRWCFYLYGWDGLEGLKDWSMGVFTRWHQTIFPL